MVSWGAHVLLWAREASTPAFVGAIEHASQHGLDFVQVSLSQLDNLDIDRLDAALTRNHLRAVTGLALPAKTDPIDDPSTSLAFLTRAIDATAALGSSMLCGALYTPMGYQSERQGSDQRQVLTGLLRGAAEHAAPLGVRLSIEPLNRYETSLLNTADEALALIEAIGAENVDLHLDTFHMNIEEHNFRDPVIDAGTRLGFVQVAESDRGIPGTGQINWTQFAGALSAAGYAGPLALESFNAGNRPLARATSLWRDVVGDADDYVRAALAFLRPLMAAQGLR